MSRAASRVYLRVHIRTLSEKRICRRRRLRNGGRRTRRKRLGLFLPKRKNFSPNMKRIEDEARNVSAYKVNSLCSYILYIYMRIVSHGDLTNAMIFALFDIL